MPHWSTVRSLIATGGRFHLATVTLALNVRADLLVVGALTTSHATGLYSLGVTLADAAGFASVTLAQSAISVQVSDSQRAAAYTVAFARRSLRAAAAIGAVALVLLYPFIRLAYGPAWTGATIPCLILLASVVLATPELPVRSIIILRGGTGALVRVAAAALVVNLGLDFVLVPLLGLIGASLASLVSAGVFTLLTFHAFTSMTGLTTAGIFPGRRLRNVTKPGL